MLVLRALNYSCSRKTSLLRLYRIVVVEFNLKVASDKRYSDVRIELHCINLFNNKNLFKLIAFSFWVCSMCKCVKIQAFKYCHSILL